VYDLDGDGDNEILVSTGNFLSIYNANGTLAASKNIAGLGGAQPSISISGGSCGSPRADVVVVPATLAIKVYCYNGTAIYNVKNQTSLGAGGYASDYARCTDVSIGAYDCYYSRTNGLVNYWWGCDLFSGSTTEFCENYANTSTGAFWEYVDMGHQARYPADEDQNDAVVHAWQTSALHHFSGDTTLYRFLWQDTGEYIQVTDISYAASHKPLLITRNAATDYIAYVTTAGAINVFDTAMGGKTLKFTMTYNASANCPTCGGSWATSPSTPVMSADGSICVSYFPIYTLATTPNCNHQIQCYNLLGVKTKEFNYYAAGDDVGYCKSTDIRSTVGTMSKLTTADITGDGVYDFFTDGLIINGATGAVIDNTTFGSGTGWMQPVDLRNRQTYDLLIGDSSGNVQIWITNASNPNTCTDTDNATYPTKNYGLKGIMSFYTVNYTDYCTDTNTLKEYYCQSGTVSALITESCTGLGYAGCQAGRCTNCMENWQCGDWSDCLAGSQTRVCSDGNACGTEQVKPSLVQTCQVSAAAGNFSATNIPINLVDSTDPLNPSGNALLPQLYTGLVIFFGFIISPLLILGSLIILALIFWSMAKKMGG
jgi:hypothetical protein